MRWAGRELLMNWILLLARNNLYLTRKAAKTALAQDVGDVRLLIIDNACEDGTSDWIQTQRENVFSVRPVAQVSVAAAWNRGLKFIFNNLKMPHCLVINNDVELRPDTYRHLVRDGGGFVTAVGSRDPEKIRPCRDCEQHGYTIHYDTPNPAAKRPHPDFSCYLIRKETWEKVGQFDERFEIAFCEDWDYHCRLHQAGILAEALELPFLHHGSMTVKMADINEQRRISIQADRNRESFRKKWGFAGGSPDYYKFFESGPPPEPDAKPSFEKVPDPVPSAPVPSPSPLETGT